MAGLAQRFKTPEGRELVTRTDSNGKTVIESFHLRLFKQLKERTVTELRVVAEESREMVLDRLYGARPQPPGTATLARPPVERSPDLPSAARTPFRHAPLAPSTVEKKAEAGGDGRKLIDQGDYTYGIEVFKGTERGETYYMVRPKPGLHPSGLPHRIIAAFAEYGTSKMPKRPHWGPTLRLVKEVVKARRKKLTAEAMRKTIRKVG